MTARLVFFESWVDAAAERVLSAQPEIEVQRLRYADPRAVNDAAMARAHGYQVQSRTELREPWLGDAALLARSPNLLAMSSTGAGYDYIDVEACTKAGVIVCHQSGTNTEAVAEHALGLILALSKRIGLADKAMRRPGVIDRFALQGNDIRGKTVGLVGLGAIGTRVAGLCGTLFGMRVLACDPYLSAAQVAARGAEKVELPELLRHSDFVSVHCPRNAETLGLFDAAQFAQMKPTAFFLNTARGGIHDEAALAEALAASRIAGAGVDVFLHEPPPHDHPLMAFDNVLLTPHTAGITAESLHDMAVGAAEQWVSLFAGRVPPRLVNPEAWPAYSARFRRILGTPPDPLP
ncbi:hydroxyacid dehydrogenase [Falsiroseomonas sp. E2-1-a20]|uniref:hydroxyacid dehydrogenase n=1 Tax=Falsiroseomonas sp. E2-1-a20 TaxID=3239300 RepID=UPI003F2DDD7A